MTTRQTGAVLVAIQGEAWGITVESGSARRALETQAQVDAKSDAFLHEAVRALHLARQEPDRAQELIRVATIHLVNGIVLDNQEDEYRAAALNHVGAIRSLARRCSDWVKVFVGGNQPSQKGRTRPALGGKTSDERALGRRQG